MGKYSWSGAARQHHHIDPDATFDAAQKAYDSLIAGRLPKEQKLSMAVSHLGLPMPRVMEFAK
jgi:hypothetical protein